MEAMTNTIKLEINGQEITARAGQTILEVVEEQKLDTIPTLCHSPELKPYGSCFLCVVQVEGRPSLLPSCATRVAPGMKVQTKNARIEASRKTALELLLSNHYADCVSPCSLGCPAHIDIQGYVALAAMGEYKEALHIVRQSNPLTSVCGRICVRKCEVVCRRVDTDEPVGINYIKRFLSDTPGAYDDTPVRRPSTGKKIGIVGSGPAGLTAAWFLGQFGHDVVIYEAMPKPGGMLRYGIPEYRLPKAILDMEIDYICKAGATIQTNTRIGRDVTLEDLRSKHDAMFIAAGAFGSKDIGVPGEHETEGIVSGVEFLVENSQKIEDGAPPKLNGTVVVVGGGNTAMDCARTSWRLGADKVIILYRRTKAEMPADKLEIEDCIKEGIEILELAAPIGLKAENGKLKALTCQRMKLGEPDSSGRRRPVVIEGSEFDLPCDMAIAAIGQNPILEGLTAAGSSTADITRWGTYVINTKTMETNVPGLYAGGDAADDGPTVVVDAIRDGQQAAKAIHTYLTGEVLPGAPFVVEKAFWSKPGAQELGDIPETIRHEVHEIDVEERRDSFAEVATGYDFEDMYYESTRCLCCGCVVFHDCPLRKYAQEYNVDMNRFKGYIRKHKVDDRHPHIMYDPNKCILCGRCIRTCERVLPISAIGLVNRGFKTEMRPALNDPLAETNCVSCGNCVDACPVGALTLKFPYPGRASIVTDDTQSHCAFCSIACPITIHKIGTSHYFITSDGEPGSYLCQYGRFGNELFIKQKRLNVPMVREGVNRSSVSFEEAYKRTVAGLKSIADKYGPESVAVFVSPELTNEEMYLASRFAREALHTNNIGSISVVLRGLGSGSLDKSFGFTSSTADRTALRHADLIICNNTNTEEDHLILNSEILISVKENGAKLVVCNSSEDPLAVLAHLKVDPFRGRASLLWNAVIHKLITEEGFDVSKLDAIEGAHDYIEAIKSLNLRVLIESTGVESFKIDETVDLIKSARKVVIVHSPDRVQDQAPGDLLAIANLINILRAIGIEADLLVPCILANALGMETAGADPVFLPGRKHANGLAGAKCNEELHKLLDEGTIRGALIIGEDPMREDKTASFFRHIEFLAAMDWAETETAEFANVAIPASTFLEQSGSRINFEGRHFTYNQAVKPPCGIESIKSLSSLLITAGVSTSLIPNEIAAELEKLVRQELGDKVVYYWNTGEERSIGSVSSLLTTDPFTKASPIPPVVTVSAKYKQDIHDVGVEHYKIKSK